MDKCPSCGYIDPTSFKNRPLTNEMNRYVQKNNPSKESIFNSGEDTFTDGNNIAWIQKDVYLESLKTPPTPAVTEPVIAPPPPSLPTPPTSISPPKVVAEPTLESVKKPIIPLPKLA